MNGDEAAHESNRTLNRNLHLNNKYNSFHSKVDINDLLSRVRDDEKKQKKENLVFFGLVAAVVTVTGIIASL